MSTWLRDIGIYVLSIRFLDVLDLLLVAALVYGLLYVVRGTRAVQLLRGILLILLFGFIFSQFLDLPAFKRIIRAIAPAIWVAPPIIFQPELRRAFERLGRAGLFAARGDGGMGSEMSTVVALAARRLSDQRHGALIVIERGTRLDELSEKGLALDATLSEELLVQIFWPNSPLHDGAIVLRGDRILAARVVLPLGEPSNQTRRLGTRHLAAVSVTRAADVVAVVVSEETGTISLAIDGKLVRRLDEGALATRLYHAFAGQQADEGGRRGLGGLEPLLREPAERLQELWADLASRLPSREEQDAAAGSSSEADKPAGDEPAAPLSPAAAGEASEAGPGAGDRG